MANSATLAPHSSASNARFSQRKTLCWISYAVFCLFLLFRTGFASAANDAQILSKDTAQTVIAGSTFYIVPYAKNTGTTTWTMAAGYSMSLQNGSGWQAPPGQNLLKVGPGDSASYMVALTAPSTPGVYVLYFRMEQKGVGAFGGTAAATITVEPTIYNAEMGAPIAMTPIEAGATGTVYVVMKNTGNTMWKSGEVTLDTVVESGAPRWTTKPLTLSTSVAPGSQATFSGNIVAPTQPGTYDIRWQMQQGSTRFGAVTPAQRITVSGPPPTITITSPKPDDVFIATNYRASVPIKITATPSGVATITRISLQRLNPLGSNYLEDAFVAGPVFDSTLQLSTSQNQLIVVAIDSLGKKTQVPLNTKMLIDDSTVVSNTVPSTMIPGLEYDVSVVMKNTGTTSWDPRTVELVSINPLENATWGPRSIPLEATVPPNGTAKFTVHVRAPDKAGTYYFEWRLRERTRAVFGSQISPPVIVARPVPVVTLSAPASTVSVDVPTGDKANVQVVGRAVAGTSAVISKLEVLDNNVSVLTVDSDTIAQPVQLASGVHTLRLRATDNWGIQALSTTGATVIVTANGASYSSQSIPATMQAGKPYTLSVTMSNSGSKPWTAANYALAAPNPQFAGIWGVGRTAVTTTVNAGYSQTFSIPVIAPAKPGTYDVEWQMVQGANDWFGKPTPKVTVQVKPALPIVPALASPLATDKIIATGGKASLRVQGSATAGDGAVVSKLEVLDGTLVIASTETGTIDAIAPLAAGPHTLRLRATDDYGQVVTGATATVINVLANNAVAVSRTANATMAAGQTYQVTVSMRNTGTSTWTAEDKFVLSDQSGTSVWRAVNVPLATPVAPGATANFVFDVVAPGDPGTYPFQWQMLREGYELFGGKSVLQNIVVTGTPPKVVMTAPAGGTTATAANGYAAVKVSGSGIATGTATINKIEVLDAGAPIDTVIAAAYDKAVQLAPGTHRIRLRVTDSRAAVTTGDEVVVTVLKNDAAFVSQSVPAEMYRAERYTVSVTVRNTGDTVWQPIGQSGGGGIALAAANPLDNHIWRPDGRVPLDHAVQPGENTTFTFDVIAPAEVGVRDMQWRMVDEGREHFGKLSDNAAVRVVLPPLPVVEFAATPMNTRAAPGGTADIRLTGNATEAKGTISKLEVYRSTTSQFDGMPVKTVTGPSVALALDETMSLARGSYLLKLRATDGAGRTNDSAPLVVNVTDSPLLGAVAGIRSNGRDALQLVGWACQDTVPEPLSYRVFAHAPPSLGGMEIGAGVADSSPDAVAGTGEAQCHTPGTSHQFRFDLDKLAEKYPGATLFVAVRAKQGEEAVLPCEDNYCRLPEGMRIGLTSPSPLNLDHFRYPAPAFVRAVVSGLDGVPDEVMFNINGEWLAGVAEGGGAYSVTRKDLPATAAPYSVTARVRQGKTTLVTPERLFYIDAGAVPGQITPAEGTQVSMGRPTLLGVAFEQAKQAGQTVRFYIDKAMAQRRLMQARVSVARAAAAVAAESSIVGSATFDGARWVYTWSPNEAGQYSVTAKLFDGSGAMLAETGGVTLTVGAGTDPNAQAPTPLAPVALPDTGTVVAGSLPGELGVDNSGGAAYAIALVVPPGTAGIQPQLTLSYNSAGVNGLLGLGWSLDGISSVRRCAKTIAQDGVNGRIAFANSDRLCLDGQRLVLVNQPANDDNYWADNAEYRTEINNMARVTAQGTGAARSFKVEYANGRIARFGTGTGYVQAVIQHVDSGLTAPQPVAKNGAQSWAVSSIEDRSGNFIRFTYEQDSATGEHRPFLISYGGTGLPAHAAVQFAYEGRDDSWKRYIDETRNDLRSRVSHIRTFVGEDVGTGVEGATLVLDYALTYEKSPTSGRSLLKAVQATGYNGGPAVALPATEFTWGKPDPAKTPGFESRGLWNGPVLTTHKPTRGVEFGTLHEEFFSFADFDRDGRGDVLEKRVAGPAAHPDRGERDNLSNPIPGGTLRSSYRYFHNTGSGFTVLSYGISTGEPFVVMDIGDFNGDGLPDLLVDSASGSKICISPMNNADALPPQIIFQCGTLPASAKNYAGIAPTMVVDVLGEGRAAHYEHADGTNYANLCIQETCVLDTDPPVRMASPKNDDGSKAYARLAHTNMEQMVDFGGTGKPYNVGWTKVRYTKYVYDGDKPQYQPTFQNMQPQVVVTGFAKPGEPDAGPIARYSYPRYPTPRDPTANKPDEFPKVEQPYEFDTRIGQGSLYADLNGSGYNSLAYGFLELDWDHTRVPVLPRYRNADFTVCLSTGRALDCGVRRKYSGSEYRSILNIGNFVGDGAPALLTGTMSYPEDDGPILSGNLEMCRLTGDDTSGGASTNDANMVCTPWPGVQMPTYADKRAYFMDLLGTGRTQLVVYHLGKVVNNGWVEDGRWEVFAPKDIAPDGQALDRIVSVRNGLGAVSSVEYVDGIPAGIVTSSGQSKLTYPQQPKPAVGKLVRRLQVTTGAGGSIAKTYQYRDHATDVAGRGGLGFSWVTVTDEQYQTRATTEFAQAWPFTQMPIAASKAANGCVTQQTTYALALADIAPSGAGSTVLPYSSASSTVYRDLGTDGQCYEMGTEATATGYGDGWGNVTSESSTRIGDGKTFATVSATQHENRGDSWVIGRPVLSRNTRSDSATGDVTRTTAATYDLKSGLETSRTVEPDDPTYRMSTTFDRNNFGLLWKQTESWLNPACAKPGWPIEGCQASRSRVTTTLYDGKGRFVGSKTNALNHTTFWSYDPGTGFQLSVTGPNKVTTTRIADPFGRIVEEQQPDGNALRTQYVRCDANCPSGAAMAIVAGKYIGTQRSAVPVITYQDSAGHAIRSHTYGFDGREIVTDQVYDNRGRNIESFHPRFTTDAPVLALRVSYDAFDRAIVTAKPDELGALAESTTNYQGFTRVHKNAKGQLRTELYDAAGQVRQVTDALNGNTSFSYEPFGALARTTDPAGNVSNVTYDRLGRRAELNDPDLGKVTYDVDPTGQVYAQTSPGMRAKSSYTAFSHDLLGRMIARYEPDLISHWEYDTAANGIGQLARVYTGQISRPDYQRVHNYDVLGRPGVTQQLLSDAWYTNVLFYDGWGRPSRQEYRRGSDAVKTFTFRYNALGYPSGIARGELELASTIEMDAARRETKVKLGNGLLQTRSYNPYTGLLSAGVVRAGETDVVSEGYEYDLLGSVAKRVQYVSRNGAVAGFMEAFTYDDLNRLRTANVNGVESGFTYDAAGSIRTKTGVGTYNYPEQGEGALQPHAVRSVIGGPTDFSYTYDLNGNLVSGGGRRACWTSFDMPSVITKGGADPQCRDGIRAAFVYGPEHQRLRQFRNAGEVIYAGAQEVEAIDGRITVRTYWPGGLGVEIDRQGAGAELNWWHKDRLGSPVAYTDAAGRVIDALEYDPWGKRRNPADHHSTPDTLEGKVDNRGFTGHEMLDQLDLVHMNGRVYDPLIGKFLSGDPLVQDPTNGQSFNRYSYVLNNPTNLTDPTGFAACTGSRIERESCGSPEQDMKSLRALDRKIAAGWTIIFFSGEKDNRSDAGTKAADAKQGGGNGSRGGTNVSADTPSGFDPKGLPSALLDAGKGVWNLGMGLVEGIPNLIGGAIPGAPDYLPFMANYRASYDTPVFGTAVEVLAGVGVLRTLSEFGYSSNPQKASSGTVALDSEVLGKEIGTITTRTTRSTTRLGGEAGEPGVKIKYRNGTEFDMTATRVKQTELNPYVPGGTRPMKFEGALNKQGTKRAPTAEELSWFNSIFK